MPNEAVQARTPPHDVQAEMGVLGSMLLSKEAAYLARERLAAQSFYRLNHQAIFDAVVGLLDERSAVDVVLLRDELGAREQLDRVGGVAYLLELMEAVPTSANVEHYVEIVKQKAARRHLIETAVSIQKSAYEDGKEVDSLLDEAESRMMAVRHMRETGHTRDMNVVLQNIVARLERLHQNPGQLSGLATGFYDLDEITGGLQQSELIVIAARPSVGKTSLALNILHHICTVERRPALLYTLEMPAEQIVSNFLCIHNRIDTADFRRGTLDEQQWEDIETSFDDMAGLPLVIDDSPTLNVMELRARARRMAMQQDLALIVVDYLQLLQPHKNYENRATSVAAMSQGLKALARELEVPLIAISQLNRAVEQEQRTPRMSDLRESGAIEQDADVILLLHRPEELKADDSPVAGAQAEVLVAKQRNGPTGVCRLVFLKRYLRFESSSSQQDA